jgi:hypothetical protein
VDALPQQQPLFRRLLGPGFDALPAPIRVLHEASGTRTYHGWSSVERGRGLASRFCGWIASLPAGAPRVPLAVTIARHAGGETWRREFGREAMTSQLRAHGPVLEEHLGPGRFRYELLIDGAGIRWRLLGMRILGVPWPARWAPRMEVREAVADGLYRFDVRVELPRAMLLVHYRGALRVDAGEVR